MILIQLCILLFALSVMVVGGSYLVYTRFILDVKSAALQIPLGYVYIVVPLSGALIVYYSIYSLINLIKHDSLTN
jgi:TRAP-type C4-dicarboxylate transport system permease small subunit